MVSVALFRYFEARPDGKGKLFNMPLMLFSAALALTVVAGIIAVCAGVPGRFGITVYEKNETWKVFVLFNMLVLTLFGAVAAFTEKKTSRKLSYFIAAVLPLFLGMNFIVPQSFYDARSMDQFLEEIRDEITPDTLVIAHGSNMHAICYAYHRNDLYVIFPGELTYGLTCKEAEEKDRKRNQPVNQIRMLMEKNPGKKIEMIFPADRYFHHHTSIIFPPALSVRKSIPDDPEDKHANGQVLVRFQ